VPSDDDDSSSNDNDNSKDGETVNNKKKNDEDLLGDAASADAPAFDEAVTKLIRQRRKPPRASRRSTINGVPTEKVTGFGAKSNSDSGKPKKKSKKPYVAIGQGGERINDPSRPQVDDQGYTLYTNEETGEKSRVFEALVDYPCVFTMKIVGANEGTFVEDIVALVADACESEVHEISHSTKAMGKWTSVTVQAPVDSSEMLYTLYEKVDLDPRVKFKF